MIAAQPCTVAQIRLFLTRMQPSRAQDGWRDAEGEGEAHRTRLAHVGEVGPGCFQIV
jgi:hypothetical protein